MKKGHTQFFKPKWLDKPDIQRFVSTELLKGKTLNFPCGRSNIGDVQADIDKSVKPDICADLMNRPFKRGSFDTVYCDPPYKYYAYDKIHSWVHELWKIADKRLILQTRNEAINFSDADRTVYFADNKQGCMQYLVLQVFDQQNKTLDAYE